MKNLKKDKNAIYVTDGNEAVADVAYRINEICIIYPITPASSMGELPDLWASKGNKNIWNMVPDVVEMQSEGGVCGAMHGALQTGALATTFTSSQGLLLMIPDMYHISAELSPTVFHVASRAVASQGMTIYAEHSDVMAVRQTGFGMLCSDCVQTAHDNALIAQMISLETRVPYVHFFDGFRTSHEERNIVRLTDEQLKTLIDNELVYAHRERRLCSENPVARGVVQNNDIYFQGRESVNSFYEKTPEIVQKVMRQFKDVTGREYHTLEYTGHPEAERVVVVMGSAASTVRETAEYFAEQGEKVGCINVRLFQPFPSREFLKILPSTCRAIAVLDRTKEPGAAGEPLYQKITSVLMSEFSSGSFSKSLPKVVGGRYGLAGKAFTPAMIKAIFENLSQDCPKHDFTIGIKDDVTHTSLDYDSSFDIEAEDVYRAIFYGLGADGTVGANKNSIKILGEETDNFVQGYFAFDARKSGARTVSYLRISPRPILSAYKTQSAQFIGCHQFHFLDRIDVLQSVKEGATFLLNSPFSAKDVWQNLPQKIQQIIIDKKLKFYVVDAYKVAVESGMGKRINTIMQACFFELSDLLPKELAIQKIKSAVKKTYARKGEDVVQKNLTAIDKALENLHVVEVPQKADSGIEKIKLVPQDASDFMKNVIDKMLVDRGDELPISLIPNDGTYPLQTTRFEKHNVSFVVPEWHPDHCIQCGRCSLVCPHSVIRVKQADKKAIEKAPDNFQHMPLRSQLVVNSDLTDDKKFLLQVYVEDCTGCGLCVEACPRKDKAINMTEKALILEQEQENIRFFETLPYISDMTKDPTVQTIQFLQPLFEFSCACAGCGETPYVKLISQLFGDRAIIANACGCSSVFGGNLPSIPWAKNQKGHGPAWSSSLFEDNAEFGYGFRLTEDMFNRQAKNLLQLLVKEIGEEKVNALLNATQKTHQEIDTQRERVEELKAALKKVKDNRAKELLSIADYLVEHSIWAVGGDGWAYDIGFCGVDHVIASGRNINLLVLDTEVYSNTGGQASKATPRGAVAKFAANGEEKAKKDLGIMAMSYETAYVASISLGSSPAQAIRAIKEAEAYNGPSVILAYSHCIAHGIDMRQGMHLQDLAVKSGCWMLYRYDPDRAKQGLNPMQLDSKKPSIPISEYTKHENRFRILERINPKHAEELMKLAQEDIDKRWQQYEKMAKEE